MYDQNGNKTDTSVQKNSTWKVNKLQKINGNDYFENYKNKLATCPKNKYEIYQCQKSAFLNSTETSE
ncbi:hypothetical protein ATN96_03395 [Companilactobacillus paralimentarius]|nr:hypothetical protein ATN96_03395 [Companilactobacillus paralimentarius]